jgi:hypothetical protein
MIQELKKTLGLLAINLLGGALFIVTLALIIGAVWNFAFLWVVPSLSIMSFTNALAISLGFFTSQFLINLAINKYQKVKYESALTKQLENSCCCCSECEED